MRELTEREIDLASGGYTVEEGLAAVGVVAGGAVVAAASPIAAGAIVGGVIGVTAFDIANNLS